MWHRAAGGFRVGVGIRFPGVPFGTGGGGGCWRGGVGGGRGLAERGVSVLVLEARDRVGGRIHTSRVWSGVPMDLGASWIHGTEGNPVTTLAQQAEVTMMSTSYDSGELYVSPAWRSAGLTGARTDHWEGVVEDAVAWG